MDVPPRRDRNRLRRLPMLMRGESAVASVGMSLVVIVLAAVVACGGWLIHTQRAALTEARQQRLEAVSDVLAGAVEPLLAEGRLTDVRRLMIETAERQDLTQCRIMVGRADVIASAEPAAITANLDTANWAGASPQVATVSSEQSASATQRALQIDGHGAARLELSTSGVTPVEDTWQAQAGIGVIGAAALLALLVVYRQFRARLRAMGVVREALLAMQRGETASSALAVAGDLGEEAVAWNRMLDEQQQLRRQAVVERTRETQGAAGGGSESELTVACDAVSHGLLLVDDRLHVRYANSAATIYLQANQKAFIDAQVDTVIDDQDILASIREAVNGKLRRRVTHELHHNENGSTGVLRFHIHPVRRGERALATVVVDDVTQQRVAEETRHQFVAQATHELRTPLTNIRLYLDALQDDDVDATSRGQALNVLNQETYRLDRLVGDMLSMAEIEAGSFALARDDVRIDELINAVRDDYAAQASEKQITLTAEVPPKLPVVQGDRDKLMLAMQNLVGNAVKYTSTGGQVTVVTEADSGRLSIEVRDTGIGIATEDLDQIFEKFYRAADKRVSEIAGTGLGLALAREIVRLHGGDITVKSEKDHGSTFTLTLPARTENATATEQ